MTHRDRAWRRRMSRIVEHREEGNKEWLRSHAPEGKAKPHVDSKPHSPGKLTHVQAMRLDHQLQDDAVEAWTGDAAVAPSVEP